MVSMYKTLKSQTGVVPLLLVVLLVVLVGVAGATYYYQHKGEVLNRPTAVQSAATTPDGSVDHAVNSVTAGAAADDSLSQNSTDSQQLDQSSSAASNVTGSYNENNF